MRDIANALDLLGRHRRIRLAVFLAVNAVASPYANLIHDAQLYAFQVLNRVHGGAFASDLFLKYGSQDQYTPFSMLAAPVARVVGVEVTFFVFFLVSNALLIVAFDSLVTTLIDDRVARTATALYLAMSALPYAGLRVFFVKEAFFTPRILASALAVFALAYALRRRHAVAWTAAVLAMLVHPLMGAPAVVVLALLGVSTTTGPKLGAAVAMMLTVVPLLGLVTWQSLGFRLFGTMDVDWVTLLRHASPYVFLQGWTSPDWARLVAAGMVVTAAALATREAHPDRSALFLAATLAAGAGLAATVIATTVGYTLLVQAQPYRAVWILQLLQIPALAVVAQAALARGSWALLAGAAALTTIIVSDFVVYEAVFAAVCFIVLSLIDPRMRSTRHPELLATGLMLSVLAGTTLWGAVKLIVIVSRAAHILRYTDLSLFATMLMSCIPHVAWFAAVTAGLAWALPRLRRSTCVAAAGTLALVPHLISMTAHAIPALQERVEPHARDARFVRSFIDARGGTPAMPPTVYAAPWNDLGLVWLALGARNYFAVVVVIFSRETGFETLRRAGIVRPFELARYREMAEMLPPVTRPLIDYFFAPERPASSPSLRDLARVCAPEEHVDIVVLAHDFGPLASANNGRVFLYECDRIRAASPALAPR